MLGVIISIVEGCGGTRLAGPFGLGDGKLRMRAGKVDLKEVFGKTKERCGCKPQKNRSEYCRPSATATEGKCGTSQAIK